MGEMTTIEEILEFAIAREAETVHFYMAMAQRVSESSCVEHVWQLGGAGPLHSLMEVKC